jgi:hypothetical protein
MNNTAQAAISGAVVLAALAGGYGIRAATYQPAPIVHVVTVNHTITRTETHTRIVMHDVPVPGPTVTQNVPGPTVTVPGPTMTQMVPGPTVTVTAPTPMMNNGMG